jgi:hypothetical protein
MIMVKGKVWKYPGFGGWHFITIGKVVSGRIKKLIIKPPDGFGSIHVKAIIGATEWKTSIFPTKEKTFLLPVKANVRKAEGVEEGDTVVINLTVMM